MNLLTAVCPFTIIYCEGSQDEGRISFKKAANSR
jgi:hypothetical protein